MKKKLFVFSAILALATTSFPQSVLGLAMNVTVTIDSIKSPARGPNIAPNTNLVPGTDLEMAIAGFVCLGHCYTQHPRLVVIQNGNSISGSSVDVSGGMRDSSNYYRALNIVNATDLTYKSNFSGNLPSGGVCNYIPYSDYFVDFTKQGNISFNYTTTGSPAPTYKLYVEICGDCSVTANAYCTAGCNSVAAPVSGSTNCAAQMLAKNGASSWYSASCNVPTAVCLNRGYVFLGTVNNTNAYNMFYIFLNQLIP